LPKQHHVTVTQRTHCLVTFMARWTHNQ